MTIVLVAFRDDPGRAVLYNTFSGVDAISKAVLCYQRLLEQAQSEAKKRKPRVISTRIIVP